jgi:hypothetical protein
MLDLLFGLFIGVIIGVIAHEAGHAAMALVTGLRLRAITIGYGTSVFAKVCRGIEIKLNAIPLSGRVEIFLELHQRRIALLAFASGGIAANVLLGLAAVLLSASGYLPKNPHQAAIGFYCVQAWLIARNLIPHTRTVGGATIPNDGRVILSLLGQPDETLSPFAQVYLSALAPYTSGKDPISTLSPASQRLMTYTYLKFTAEIDRRNREDIFRKFATELAKGELSLEEELFVLDDLVTHAVVTGDPETKAHIDEWSSRAVALGPNIKTLKFSRGAALIELGRFAEGRALVEALAGPDEKPFDSLLNTTFLARAEAGLGNLEHARQLLSAARELLKKAEDGQQREEIHRLIDETGKKIE